MKKIFQILQQPWCAVTLGIIFLSVPKWTKDFGLGATWVILASSAIIFTLVLWNLLSGWVVNRQGYLIANLGGALSGTISSLTILAYVNNYINNSQLNLFLLISFCMGIVVFIWGMFNEWCVRPWTDDKGKPSSRPEKSEPVATSVTLAE